MVTPSWAANLKARPLRARLTEHQDSLIAVVGGTVFCVASAWWALAAIRSDAPPDAPDGFGLRAALYAGAAALTIVPGVLALYLHASRPNLARRCATSGRVVVVTVACLYVVGRLALMQLDGSA